MTTNFPHAVIFDLDGVIADTIPAHLQAWIAVLAECGVTLTPDDFQRRFNGQINVVIIRETLGSDVGDDEIARISADKERRYRALTQSHLRPLPGLPEFVTMLVAKRVPRAIATAAPPENVAHVLAAVGLRDAFPIVVDSSMVTRGKPAPDLFLRAAEKLGVAPTDCVVFEDSLNGVEAARQAGMRVVALTTTHTPDELLRADLVIDDFLQFSLADLSSLSK